MQEPPGPITAQAGRLRRYGRGRDRRRPPGAAWEAARVSIEDFIPDGWRHVAKRDVHPRKSDIYDALVAVGRASARVLALTLEDSPRVSVIAYHLRAMREIGLVEPVELDADPEDPDTDYRQSYQCLLLRPTDEAED